MFWAYILRCADSSYYTGHTDNLERRIGQYQSGECAGYTVTRRPVELAWSQEFVTREETLAAEMQIKGWSRKKKEAMMRGDWREVSRLAQSKPSTSKPSTVRGDPSTSLRTKGFVEPPNPSTGSGRTESGGMELILLPLETET
jgi:putative endonuclease